MYSKTLRTAGLLLWILVISFLLLELVIRIYFSIRVDSDVFFWGTQWHRDRWQQSYLRGQNVFEHENIQSGYSKYFPYQKRSDVDSNGNSFEVTINGKGFRGVDYTTQKSHETLRILTLGASSTFGFGNHDDETYPFLLEQLLNERLSESPCRVYKRAEVINFGIPHLDSEQVSVLFSIEGLPLKPDAVTIYSGYNNTRGLGQNKLLSKLSRYWLVFNFIRTVQLQKLQASEFLIQQETKARTRSFIKGLDKILAATKDQDIALLPITQQVRALPAEKIHQQQISYVGEIAIHNQKLEQDGVVSMLKGKLLIHKSLSNALRRWSQENNLMLIDGIELLDGHRYLLTTYVHLAPLANELLALSIADGLAEEFGCPQLTTKIP